MSACVKFRLERPTRLAGHTEQTDRQTDKHIAFYYIDIIMLALSLNIPNNIATDSTENCRLTPPVSREPPGMRNPYILRN